MRRTPGALCAVLDSAVSWSACGCSPGVRFVQPSALRSPRLRLSSLRLAGFRSSVLRFFAPERNLGRPCGCLVSALPQSAHSESWRQQKIRPDYRRRPGVPPSGKREAAIRSSGVRSFLVQRFGVRPMRLPVKCSAFARNAFFRCARSAPLCWGADSGCWFVVRTPCKRITRRTRTSVLGLRNRDLTNSATVLLKCSAAR